VKINSTRRLKRHEKRDTAKATIEARINVTMTAGTVIATVLKKWVSKLPRAQASM
jgi:tellurite resistance protein